MLSVGQVGTQVNALAVSSVSHAPLPIQFFLSFLFLSHFPQIETAITKDLEMGMGEVKEEVAEKKKPTGGAHARKIRQLPRGGKYRC